MNRDIVVLPKRPRRHQAATEAAAKRQPQQNKQAQPETDVEIPVGTTIADCEQVRMRTGFRLMHSGLAVAQQSHGGRGLENVPIKCFLKGHVKCKRAIGILQLSDNELLCRWVLAGAGCATASDHAEVPLASLALPSSLSSS